MTDCNIQILDKFPRTPKDTFILCQEIKCDSTPSYSDQIHRRVITLTDRAYQIIQKEEETHLLPLAFGIKLVKELKTISAKITNFWLENERKQNKPNTQNKLSEYKIITASYFTNQLAIRLEALCKKHLPFKGIC